MLLEDREARIVQKLREEAEVTPVRKSRLPIGVILAGGPGIRIGGEKAIVALGGRPLLRYPLDVMRTVVREVAVITKPQVLLPRLDGAMVWIEPDLPEHPLLGVVEALALAAGRPVLVCPMDFPFLSAALLAGLASAAFEDSAVVASCRGVPQPLVGCYRPAASAALWQVVQDGLDPAEVVALLRPRRVEVADDLELFDVNTPDDLLQAAALLDQRRVASRT